MENIIQDTDLAVDNQPDKVREQMTSKVTSYFAAEFISRPEFPKKDSLPSILPLPFLNFGHQVLFDYGRFLKIIWTVVEQIKTVKPDSTMPIWIVFAVPAFFVFVALASQVIAFVLVALVSLIALGVISNTLNSGQYADAIADIKANAMQELIDGRFELNNKEINERIDACLTTVGNGAFDTNRVPVIIASDNEQPFSGYGLLQLDNLFVCKEKKERSDNKESSIEELERSFFHGINKIIKISNRAEVTSGEIVLIKGDSLLIDSAWLDNNKTPKLWVEKEHLERIHQIDSRSSLRKYQALQIIFPDHFTVANIFIRFFYSGNAFSCHLALSTIGPPVVEYTELMERLTKYKLEKKAKDKNQPKEFVVDSTNLKEAERKAIEAVRYIYLQNNKNNVFTTFKASADIKKLDINEMVTCHGVEYAKEFNNIVDKCTVWPGDMFNVLNWRENHSNTFPTDFFGRTESMSSIKNIYEQVSGLILDKLDDMGYDISNYKDKEGKYIINSERIEQLVVGENIHVIKERIKNEKIKKEKGKEEQQKQSQASEDVKK